MAETDSNSAIQKILVIESKRFKLRLKQIKSAAYHRLHEFHTKISHLRASMEEWTHSKHESEINAIHECLLHVRIVVESEAKLQHELVLENEKFAVNFEVLAYDTETEAHPDTVEEIKGSGYLYG